jgi:NAD(P)H-dependent FMN reductase
MAGIFRAQLGLIMRALHLIWHSRTGTVQTLVQAVLLALSHDQNIRVRAIAAEQAVARDLLDADALIFMAPENLGALSGMMKEFFDRHYYACLDQANGKAYASVIAAGSDGGGAERQLDRICTGLRLRRVAQGLIVLTSAQSKAQIEAQKQLSAEQIAPVITLAQTMAEGLKLGIF